MAFYPRQPALRLVNSAGAVVAGPLKLWLPYSGAVGTVCTARCEYAPEMLGPYMNTAYQKRWRVLGYRWKADVTCPLVLADGLSGVTVLLSYLTAAFASETYAALQFNLYHDTCNVWRGCYPTSGWAPRALGGKDRAGYEVDLSFEARDLIAAPGDWSLGTW